MWQAKGAECVKFGHSSDDRVLTGLFYPEDRACDLSKARKIICDEKRTKQNKTNYFFCFEK